MNNQQRMLVVGAVLVAMVVTASGYYHSITQPRPEGGKMELVATFYPLAYFAEEIGGEHVVVTQLVPDNTEVHTVPFTQTDILTAEKAEIIIYNGANLDHWMETDILSVIDTSDKIVVETTRALEDLDELTELSDPHTWISPFIAKQQAQKIYEALIQKDPDHQEYYTARWQDLKGRFEALDNDFKEGLSMKQKTEIFVTHAAFGYLADRYGFRQHGIIGMSADEQPSSSTIKSLVDMMSKRETYVIYLDPVYPDHYARTLKSNLETHTGHSVQILHLYLMLGPVDGMDYFEQQKANLANLKIGLEAS